MKHLKNNNGFSLVFAMGIVLTISLTTIYLLEYVVPFAKDTKGVEFSSNAFYQTNSAIEEALLFVAKNPLGDEATDLLEPIRTTITNPSGGNQEQVTTDMGYDIVARGSVIPPLGEGNSEYDDNWNKLSISEPLQLEIGENEWDNGEIRFRVPDTGVGGSIYLKTMTGGLVAWQLSSGSGTLNSGTGADDRLGDVRATYGQLKTGHEKEFNLESKGGKTLEGVSQTFGSYYSNNCDGSSENCTLKVSVINDLILDNSSNTPAPYLEYRITGVNNIPLRYTRIKASGYSNGFKKDIDIQVPQQTVNEAFDFTVFQ